MIYPPHLPVALLLQAALCLVASAATNFSVDDQDPLFQYFPNDPTIWERITKNIDSTGRNLDMNGGHRLTGTEGAYATITYTCAYLLKINSMIIKSSQSMPESFPPFFFLYLSIFN